jgi:ubiquinone/menaquinone biosynthesis C-methylase UbiE
MNVTEVYKFYKDKAIKECNIVKGQRVLKTDCHNESGIFSHSLPIIPHIKDIVTVDALEIDKNVIDLAIKNIGTDGWTITQGDIRNLPYEDNTFDLLLDFSTIDHITPEELPNVLNEYKRVCKSNSKFTIIVWLSNKNEIDSNFSYQYYFESNYFTECIKKLSDIDTIYPLYPLGNGRILTGFDGRWKTK